MRMLLRLLFAAKVPMKTVGADIIRPVKIKMIFTQYDGHWIPHFAVQNGRADDIRPYNVMANNSSNIYPQKGREK